MNEGLGKNCNKKGNSMNRSGPMAHRTPKTESYCPHPLPNISSYFWEKVKRGVSKPVGFPLFFGGLWELFLVGAVKMLRKTIPGQIGKIPKKSGRSQEEEKARRSPDQETFPFETPPSTGP